MHAITPDPPAPLGPPVCPECGYDIGLSGAPRCPECGRHAEIDDADHHAARIVMARRMPSIVLRVVAGAAGIALAIGAVKGLIEGSSAVFALVAGVFVLVPLAALVLGGVLALRVPTWLRRVWIACWVRSIWKVHIPWLWGPVVLVLGTLGRAVPGLVPAGVCIAMPLVFIVWIAVWEPFSQEWTRSCAMCGLERHRSIGYFAAIPSYMISLPLMILMLVLAVP